jgi:hypothetical protein
LINSSNKNLITSLTLTGNLNGTDIHYIREMAGSDVNGNTTLEYNLYLIYLGLIFCGAVVGRIS